MMLKNIMAILMMRAAVCSGLELLKAIVLLISFMPTFACANAKLATPKVANKTKMKRKNLVVFLDKTI
jgi:hypothetical protein